MQIRHISIVMVEGLSERQQQIKDRFVEERGFWSDVHASVLRIDPEYIERYREFSSFPWKHGSLDPKLREFVYIAIDSSTTHLYNLGTKVHIENALDRGATVEEVLAVFEITSTVGFQSMISGAEAITEAYDLQTHADGEEPPADLPAQFSHMSDAVDFLAERDPEFLQEFTRFATHCYSEDVIDPKTQAIVEFAVTVAITHMDERFVSAHANKARETGVSVYELLEVCELVSVLGFHTTTESVPLLVEAAEERGLEIGGSIERT